MARISIYLMCLILCNSWTLLAEDIDSAHDETSQQNDTNGGIDPLRQQFEAKVLSALQSKDKGFTPETLAGVAQFEQALSTSAQPVTPQSIPEILKKVQGLSDSEKKRLSMRLKALTKKLPIKFLLRNRGTS